VSLRAKIAAGTLVLASASLGAFLGVWEGEGQNNVYPDHLAGGLPTVCKGITRHTSPDPVIIGDYWSDERCAQVEKLVTEKTQIKLADCIDNQAVTQKTFDALSSHAHNVGVASTCASRALGLINAGRMAEGCKAIAFANDGVRPVWAYVTKGGRKVFVQGLHNRRLAEMKLCLEGLR